MLADLFKSFEVFPVRGVDFDDIDPILLARLKRARHDLLQRIFQHSIGHVTIADKVFDIGRIRIIRRDHFFPAKMDCVVGSRNPQDIRGTVTTAGDVARNFFLVELKGNAGDLARIGAAGAIDCQRRFLAVAAVSCAELFLTARRGKTVPSV
jgi:hypothetical protein